MRKLSKMKKMKLSPLILAVSKRKSPLDKFWEHIHSKYPSVKDVSSVWVSYTYEEKLRLALHRHAKKKYPHLSARKIESTVGMELLCWGPAASDEFETGYAFIIKK